MVILRDDHIFAFCVVRKRAQILELFQRNAYVCFAFLLTLFTLRCTCMTDRPKSRATPTNSRFGSKVTEMRIYTYI